MTTCGKDRVVRARLDVSAKDLRAAASAVDAALNVSSAREAAAHGRRKDALQLLHGENLIAESMEGRRGSHVHKRRIELADEDTLPIVADDESTQASTAPVRPKQRSGRSSASLPNLSPPHPHVPAACAASSRACELS